MEGVLTPFSHTFSCFALPILGLWRFNSLRIPQAYHMFVRKMEGKLQASSEESSIQDDDDEAAVRLTNDDVILYR